MLNYCADMISTTYVGSIALMGHVLSRFLGCFPAPCHGSRPPILGISLLAHLRACGSNGVGLSVEETHCVTSRVLTPGIDKVVLLFKYKQVSRQTNGAVSGKLACMFTLAGLSFRRRTCFCSVDNYTSYSFLV